MDNAADELNLLEDKEDKLYIHDYFEVQTFEEGVGKNMDNNPYIKIGENLKDAIKTYPAWVPSVIVILLSNEYAHDEPFVELEFRNLVVELLSRVVAIIEDRKAQLPKKAKFDREPVIAVLRLLPKPITALRNAEKFKNTRRKANNIIESVATKLNIKFINADEITCNQKGIFNERGHLTKFGYERLWVSISNQIENLDKQFQKAWQIVSKSEPKSDGQQLKIGQEIKKEKEATYHQQAHPRASQSQKRYDGSYNQDQSYQQYPRSQHQYNNQDFYRRESQYDTPDRFHLYKR